MLRSALEGIDKDWVLTRGSAMFSLARALRDTGADTEAAVTGREALGIFERKGNVVTAAKVHAFLEA